MPEWCRSLKLSAVALAAAISLTYALPYTGSHAFLHDLGWLLLHPLWGAGFFFLVNHFVAAERSARKIWLTSRAVAWLAAVGVFSYSLYLTHQLVIMESYWFYIFRLPVTLTPLLITTPACLAFAWLFFRFCEKPFLAPQAITSNKNSIEVFRAQDSIAN